MHGCQCRMHNDGANAGNIGRNTELNRRFREYQCRDDRGCRENAWSLFLDLALDVDQKLVHWPEKVKEPSLLARLFILFLDTTRQCFQQQLGRLLSIQISLSYYTQPYQELTAIECSRKHGELTQYRFERLLRRSLHLDNRELCVARSLQRQG